MELRHKTGHRHIQTLPFSAFDLRSWALQGASQRFLMCMELLIRRAQARFEMTLISGSGAASFRNHGFAGAKRSWQAGKKDERSERVRVSHAVGNFTFVPSLSFLSIQDYSQSVYSLSQLPWIHRMNHWAACSLPSNRAPKNVEPWQQKWHTNCS